MDDPVKLAYDQHVGQELVIAGLGSERGQALNGKRCVVVGHNYPAEGMNSRLFAHVLDAGETTLKLKYSNLHEVGLESYASVKLPDPIPEDELRVEVGKAVAAKAPDPGEDLREDMAKRLQVLQGFLAGGPPPQFKCLDFLCPGTHNTLLSIMRLVSPACVGDGTADLQRFNQGLVGDGELCAICNEATEMGGEVRGLACFHVFHKSCAEAYFRHNNPPCPVCQIRMVRPRHFIGHMQKQESIDWGRDCANG